jgi:cobalamin synthase
MCCVSVPVFVSLSEYSVMLAIVVAHLGWGIMDLCAAHRYRDDLGHLAMMRYHPTPGKKTIFFTATFTIALLAFEASCYRLLVVVALVSSFTVAWVYYRHSWASNRMQRLCN